MQEVQLTAKMAVVGLLRQSLAQCRRNFGAKLCCGGVGEGDDQKFVDVFPLPANFLHHPVHQNLGFTGTGSGRYQ